MADDEPEGGDEPEKSFRERVEEIREQREEQGDPGAPGGGMGEMMGGGPGMGGNPFAQMMGGMMGGGPGGGGGELETERIVQELGRLREEVRDANVHLERIADALEDD